MIAVMKIYNGSTQITLAQPQLQQPDRERDMHFLGANIIFFGLHFSVTQCLAFKKYC